MTERIFRYVRHADVPAYTAVGWVSLGCLASTHHGRWAELMEWRGPERKRNIGSDLARAKAHEITPAEYAEIPELTKEWFADAELHVGGVKVPPEDTHD